MNKYDSLRHAFAPVFVGARPAVVLLPPFAHARLAGVHRSPLLIRLLIESIGKIRLQAAIALEILFVLTRLHFGRILTKFVCPIQVIATMIYWLFKRVLLISSCVSSFILTTSKCGCRGESFARLFLVATSALSTLQFS